MSRILRNSLSRSGVRLSAAVMFVALLVSSVPHAASYVQKPIVTHTGQALTQSFDGGAQWQRQAAPFSGSQNYQLVTDQQNSAHLFAATEQGLYVGRAGRG